MEVEIIGEAELNAIANLLGVTSILLFKYEKSLRVVKELKFDNKSNIFLTED
jgi:hypothetical protein